MSIKEPLDLAIALVSLIGFISSGHLYYRAKIQKAYAAERDFGHIKNSMQQLSAGQATTSDELDELRDEVREVKACVLSFSQRLDSILTRLEMNSGFYGRRQDSER